jgi:diguanylate cyclase (GGDEF)-like protein
VLKRLELFAALGGIPAVLGVLLWQRQAGPLPIAAAASGVVAAFLAAFAFRPRCEFKALSVAAAEREGELLRTLAELQARVDVLSAEREISLVVNEELDLKTILDRVLSIAGDALGGAEVDLWMKADGALVPKASRRGGANRFDPDIKPDAEIVAAYQEARFQFGRDAGTFRATLPLQADRETIGVVRLHWPPTEAAALSADRLRRLEAELPGFSKSLALALKTPDLYTRAVQDGLTGLWTKRHFLSESTTALEAARRYGEPLSLIMVDVDHFKKVNDTHGHVAGDAVLKGVAELLRKKVRGGSAFRYGGEEMAVLLPKATLEGAVQVAERLRKAIEAHRIAGIKVTASFGVADFDTSLAEPAAFVDKADKALYQAKEGGRNRVCFIPSTAPAPTQAPTRRWTRSA